MQYGHSVFRQLGTSAKQRYADEDKCKADVYSSAGTKYD